MKIILIVALAALGFAIMFLRGATWIDDMAEEDENEDSQL